MKILDDLGITPNNIKLYERAFTHSSYSNEADTPSYERLEFLGDAVLELIVSEYLYKNTDLTEGKMTKMRSGYVCENANYEYAMELKLNEYMRLGHGEEETGGRTRKAIVADVFESFVAAIYLDQGLDAARDFIYKVVIPKIEDKNLDLFNDYKSILQELMQTERRSLVYEVVDEYGPSHDKTFTVVVKIDDIIYGKGTAHSKKEAEQIAASDALKKTPNGIY